MAIQSMAVPAPAAARDRERARRIRTRRGLEERFGPGLSRLFSAPGRTEMGGNHTDHNRGLGLAAAVNADILAAARPTSRPVIRLHSEGFYTDLIDLDDLSPREKETGHSASLIRGVAAALKARGFEVGGFDAFTTSEVPRGAGVSSSAAFEVLVAGILNGLYNESRVDPLTLAQVAQEAENRHFGKPCGMMDQLTSALGGCISADFQRPHEPVCRRHPADFARWGLRLCLVDTGGSHSDMTGEYAACRLEMLEVARLLGATALREVDPAVFESRLPDLRAKAGDRAVLRTLHYFEENRRVELQREALERDDRALFLRLVASSGRSSQTLLQNIVPSGATREQGTALALALSERLLGADGAVRIHGGGFAGTVQAYVPLDRLEGYRRRMEAVFGEGCCHELSVRTDGVTEYGDGE